MSSQAELLALLERSATRTEKTSDAYEEVLISEGEQDITLSDGTKTPNLNKRIKAYGGQVTSVVGKIGDVTIQDISEKLELGSASKYSATDLMKAKNLKDSSGLSQEDLNKGVLCVDDLKLIKRPQAGNRVYVKSYHKPENYALAKPFKGGRFFIYEPTRSSELTIGFCHNGWIPELTKELNVYHFGVRGYGGYDDREALQQAIWGCSDRKIKLVGNKDDEYLINSFTNNALEEDATDENRANGIFGNPHRHVFELYNEINIDFNGATLKINDGLGDYSTIFNPNNYNRYKEIVIKNLIMDYNTHNNPPDVKVSTFSNFRTFLFTRWVGVDYLELSGITFRDFLGVWTLVDEGDNRYGTSFLTKTCIYKENRIEFSDYAIPVGMNDDKTCVFSDANLVKYLDNNFIGDDYGNAVTAMEVHSACAQVTGNTVNNFNAMCYIAGNPSNTNYEEMREIIFSNNNATQVLEGVLLWGEITGYQRSFRNIIISNNNIEITRNRKAYGVDTIDKQNHTNTSAAIGMHKRNQVNSFNNIIISENNVSCRTFNTDMSKTLAGLIDFSSVVADASFGINNMKIINNNIINAPSDAIRFSLDSSDVVVTDLDISGNTIKDCGREDETASSSGVFTKIQGYVRAVRIQNNKFSQAYGVADMSHFIYHEFGDTENHKYFSHIGNSYRSELSSYNWHIGGSYMNDYCDELSSTSIGCDAGVGSSLTSTSNGNKYMKLNSGWRLVNLDSIVFN